MSIRRGDPLCTEEYCEPRNYLGIPIVTHIHSIRRILVTTLLIQVGK
jgi:hypothetical protein